MSDYDEAAAEIEAYHGQQRRRVEQAWAQQGRIDALVALCEEYINELSLYNERYDVERERARLAKLKGEG